MDFNREYDREALKTFFRDEFFPDDYWPGERALHLSPNFKHIREAALLGEVKSWGLPVCEFRHDSSHDPRVSLTRETFRFMAIHSYTDLIALYTAPGSGNYRLSYVRLEFFPNEFNDRKVDVKYSNPRRYSYCLGPEAKVLTPSRILLKKGKVADLDDLRKRFSVEVVNREFYNEIANLFTELVGGERLKGKKTIKHQGSLRLGSIVDHRKMQEFAVRMIGRIVFCWFLRKKAAPGGQPLIPDPVLSLQAVKDNPGYYHAVLERLFFQVLNTPPEARREDLKTGLFVGIPFLNGGLFEPHNDDVYEAAEFSGLSTLINTVVVPDEWLEKFFELLETYNFTIDENTSMDVELSVDPEMLGRIFENLLAEINPETGETARKSTGSYYTPRPVVEYMVDESLKQYLRTRTGLDEEKLDGLLSFSREPDGLLDSEATEKVINALGQLRIIDPACGSGHPCPASDWCDA